MEGSFITTVLLPIALGIIMLGLGLSLTPADFRRIIVYPKAVLVGLACQTLLLPAVCFGVAKAFALPPELAVGLMLLSASPGGATANLYSHLAKGDVALNITLTATNSILSLLTMPLIVGFAIQHFFAAEDRIPIQTAKVVQVFAIVLVPVGIGMLIKAKNAAFAARLDKPVRALSAIFLLLVIGAALAKDGSKIVPYLRQVGVAALVFNLGSMATGYLVPLAAKLPKKQAVAIGMEIGIHNGTLAIAIAQTVLKNDTMAIPPAIYSLIMFFTAAAFGFWVSRGMAAEAPAPQEKPA